VYRTVWGPAYAASPLAESWRALEDLIPPLAARLVRRWLGVGKPLGSTELILADCVESEAHPLDDPLADPPPEAPRADLLDGPIAVKGQENVAALGPEALQGLLVRISLMVNGCFAPS
jgi:hypothetical protein